MPISISTGRKMQMFLLDLLYPNRCPCCNCSISWREYLCEACRQEVTAEPADAFCPLCGKLLRDCFCGTGLSYDRAAILTEYTGAARAGVLSMKSAASLHFGRFCGNVLGQRIAEDVVLSGYDLVVPVPMQLRKQRKRCCNPAAVFAREIAAVTRIPYRQHHEPLCRLAESTGCGRSGCHIYDHNCNEITLKRTHTRLISDTDNGPPERKPT